jgi:hypothetical protein
MVLTTGSDVTVLLNVVMTVLLMNGVDTMVATACDMTVASDIVNISIVKIDSIANISIIIS